MLRAPHPRLTATMEIPMTTADSINTTSIAFNVEALRYRILAVEADMACAAERNRKVA